LYRSIPKEKETTYSYVRYENARFRVSDASDWNTFGNSLQTDVQNISLGQKRQSVSRDQRADAFRGHTRVGHAARRRGVVDLWLRGFEISHHESGSDGTRHEKWMSVANVVTFENDQLGENGTPTVAGDRQPRTVPVDRRAQKRGQRQKILLGTLVVRRFDNRVSLFGIIFRRHRRGHERLEDSEVKTNAL